VSRLKPFVLTAEDRVRLGKKVRDQLRVGKANATRGKDLAFRLGYPDDRKVRVVIRDLIGEGVPVASSVSEPMGFYVVANPDEAFEYIRVLKERIKEDESRLVDFEKAVANMKVPEQGELGLTMKG